MIHSIRILLFYILPVSLTVSLIIYTRLLQQQKLKDAILLKNFVEIQPESLVATNLTQIESLPEFSSHLEEMRQIISNNTPPQNESWIILGFSTYKYIPAAKIWYKNLAALGYNNHFIVPLDKSTVKIFQKGKDTSFRIKMPTEFPVNEKFLYKSLGRGLWHVRLATIEKYLSQNYNVFITDVDSIWLNYLDLNRLPKHFDAFHSIAGHWPPSVYEKWGFTLCGCVAGYRATENTKKFFKHLARVCWATCDDQQHLNEFYYNMEMKWGNISEIDSKVGLVTQLKKPKILFSQQLNSTYQLPIFPLMVSTFNQKMVSRDQTPEFYQAKCQNIQQKSKLWIISPQCSKNLIEKIWMFRNVSDCFTKQVQNDWLQQPIKHFDIFQKETLPVSFLEKYTSKFLSVL